MNDEDLCRLVLDELEFDPSVDAVGISATVEQGVVTLIGHVPSFTQKMATERAAWRVKGVRAIAQEVEVRLPSDKKLNDDEIAQRALSILAWSTLVPRNGVRIKVMDGWVTLSGQVHWDYQRRAAEAEVNKLSGVVGISNQISLIPAPCAPDIRMHITDALRRHAQVEADRIHILVQEDGAIKLEGEVDSWDERRAIERAVWSAHGVTTVDDQIRISRESVGL